ncbi:MAG: hypothetical protein RIN56_09585 [Sporomusaceae bacterium]|nr:hypothetical protein [Sporomusaceae bacterium]
MVSRSEADGRRKPAVRPDAGLDGAAALEEDVYAKQEKLFTAGTSEMPS